MTKRLIVNADDYGRSAGVSSGILRAHREGIVTSTTVMVNLDGTAAHLEAALACPGLGLGLHLVSSSWKPVLPPGRVPGLVDERGFFLDQHAFWAQAATLPLDELRDELEAQVARFRQLAGRQPDHLDWHQLPHVHPRIFRLYLDLAASHRLPVRVPFAPRVPWKTWLAYGPFLRDLSGRRLLQMIAQDRKLLSESRVPHPGRSVITFFGHGALTLGHLFRLLRPLPDGVSELMCHPGLSDGALAASGYRDERERELAILTDRRVRERVRSLGIELCTFGVLASGESSAGS